MKHRMSLFLVSVFAICTPSFAQISEERPETPTLVIQGGTLFDGTGAAPRENGTIVVRGNKIQSVLRDTIQPLPEGVRLVDARGKYILPGLIDGHTHYAGHAAPLYLHYGITSVIDTGNLSPWILAQKWAIEQGLVPGPRIYTAGTAIDNPPPVFLYGVMFTVETVDAARATVRSHAIEGVDAIKVGKQLRPELMRAVIEEAHSHGIPVTGHISISAREAVMMGIDSLEHALGIPIATMTDPEKLKEIKEKRYTDVDYLMNHAPYQKVSIT